MRSAIPAALALVLMGCPPPKVVVLKEGETAEAVLARVDAAEAKVLRVQGEGRLKAEGKEGKVLITVFAAAQAPAFVHLEQLDFFGRPQVVLASDGTRFTLFDGKEGKWYRGRPNAQTMARFFPVALAPADLAALLLGKVPRKKPTQPALLAVEKNLYKLEVEGDVLYVSPQTDRVESARLGPPHGFELELTEWFEKEGARAPRRIALRREADALALELSWKDLELNGKADPSLFELQVPEGIVPEVVQ